MKRVRISILLSGLFILAITTLINLQTAQATTTGVGINFCPPLSPATGNIININNQAQLIDQAYNAPAGSTLLIAPGTYNMSNFLHVNSSMTLRGQSGNRDDVILDFGGMIGGQFGVYVDAHDVTIADLTIRNATDHGVSVNGVDRPFLYNLHIIDINDQLVKVNAPDDRTSEDGVLACSRLEYTTTAPDNYTNGISAHNAHRWIIRDNEWVRILTNDDTPVPAVLFWSNSSDTIVERNRFIDCGRGVAFGLSNGHSGGIVRNNFFLFREPHDVAIEMSHATGWLVAHNTALLFNPANGVTWGMEARFNDSQGTFANNLTNMPIWQDRDGAVSNMINNVTNAQTGWFVDANSGDFHLVASATAVIDQAVAVPQVSTDIDGTLRVVGGAPDIGADEYGVFELTDFMYLPMMIR